MQKIVSLFQRNYDGDRRVRNEVVASAEWVLRGEGVATRKWDGTCCLVRGGGLFKRYEVKPGGRPPPDFEPATDVDPNTGKRQGWVPVGDGPSDRYHREALQALAAASGGPPPDGTYELCGPRVQGNPDRAATHVLIPHGRDPLPDAPRDYAGLREFLRTRDIEGVVWHHPDGRMVKIKAKDFGIKRGEAAAAHARA